MRTPKTTLKKWFDAVDPVWETRTFDELLRAIKTAKEVFVYVPVGEFCIEVPVAKTKLIRSLEERAAEWMENHFIFEDRFMAQMYGDKLIVGGEWDFDEEEEAA